MYTKTSLGALCMHVCHCACNLSSPAKGLVALTEHQQVGWRLIKVGNCDNKNDKRHTWILFYFLMQLAFLQAILTLSSGSNHLKGYSKLFAIL